MLTNIQLIKNSARLNPKVSLVLLDWSVRESFHLLHYLASQSAPRDAFEVIIIEYYDRVSEELRAFEDQVDTWIVLNMPKHCYYHKHLMYNVGIALCNGKIVMIGDSDAMVKEGFIETIINAFDSDPNIVFHMDQFRNTRRDLHPFCYPSFEEVLGEGCINNEGEKTSGVLNTTDPLHSRNYGACMCAMRADLIAIGGSDEHIDYLGHICGPYELTFRLMNIGKREIWHQQEFLYHTWHPGQAGADNYMGPHDGKHMSTTAMEAIISKRVEPLVENLVIKALREGAILSLEEKLDGLIRPEYSELWNTKRLDEMVSHNKWTEHSVTVGRYLGFSISADVDRLIARPIEGLNLRECMASTGKDYLDSSDINDLFNQIEGLVPPEIVRAIENASKTFNTFLFTRWVKGYIRNILAHGYRSIKFHDSKSVSALVKVCANIPRKIYHSGDEVRDFIKWTRGAHGSLAVAIYYQKCIDEKNSENTDLPLILVSQKIAFNFLEAIKAEGKCGDFEVILCMDSLALEKVLRDIKKNQIRRSLVVSNDLYMHFHSTFQKIGPPDSVIVV